MTKSIKNNLRSHLPRVSIILSIPLLAMLLAACNLTAPEIMGTPTVEVLISETPTLAQTPSLTPSPIVTEENNIIPVVIASPIQESTSSAPTLVIEPSPTPGPFEHVVQDGETLLYILQQYGYFDLGPADEILRINDNITNIDVLPVNQTILIPQPTATPIPEGIELTQTAVGSGFTVEGGIVVASNTNFECHVIQEDDTLVGIAEMYNTTLEVLSMHNRQLNWSGCQFNVPSGGPGCGPLLQQGECVYAPLPTATPAPTQTPSGNETATPTPTFAPPRIISPAEGVTLSAGRVRLTWVTAGILAADETYLVEVVDRTTNGEPWNRTTRSYDITLDETLIPNDGQTHTINWRVTVVKENPGSDANTVEYVGGTGEWHTFYWQSR